MNKPRLTKKVAAGLSTIISLSSEDMAADQRREWGAAKDALAYLENLKTWYCLKNPTKKAGGDHD
jgi:hypothetical protein